MTQNRNKLIDLLIGNLAREKIINKAEAELKFRIAKGYENINIALIGEVTEKILADLKVVSPS